MRLAHQRHGLGVMGFTAKIVGYAFLKIAASLLGVELDALRRRDMRRRQWQLASVAAVSLAGMVGASTLAWIAQTARNEAEREASKATAVDAPAIVRLSAPAAGSMTPCAAAGGPVMVWGSVGDVVMACVPSARAAV